MIIRGIASRASIDSEHDFIAEGALQWTDVAAIPLLIRHDPGAIAGSILKLEQVGKDLLCVAKIDESLPAARAFLRDCKEFGFSVGAFAPDTARFRVGHITVVMRALIQEISLTGYPVNAACRVEEVYGGGLMSGMDEHWAAVAMAQKLKFFNVQHLIRYPEQEKAL